MKNEVNSILQTMQQEYTDGITEPVNKGTESLTFQKPVQTPTVPTLNITFINKI
jgi:hypothetical protein